MINKDLQKQYSDYFNIERNNTNIIFLAGYYREKDFESAYPWFDKLNFHEYRDRVDGGIWKMTTADPCCGLRIKRAIIDTRINEEVFRAVILPMCAGTCVRMDFFD